MTNKYLAWLSACGECFVTFLKKRGKGKQLIWTTQYVIVETLTNARCCFVANKSQKSSEFLGSSEFFIYLCS